MVLRKIFANYFTLCWWLISSWDALDKLLLNRMPAHKHIPVFWRGEINFGVLWMCFREEWHICKSFHSAKWWCSKVNCMAMLITMISINENLLQLTWSPKCSEQKLWWRMGWSAVAVRTDSRGLLYWNWNVCWKCLGTWLGTWCQPGAEPSKLWKLWRLIN